LSTLKKLAGQSATYGLSTILGRFLNYLLVPVYTNVFSPGEYGVVTELYSYSAFLAVLFTYGMETAFFRFASKHKDDFTAYYATAFYSLLFSSMAMGLLLFVFIQPLSALMGYEQHHDYLYLFFGILFFDTLTAIPFARLRLENKPLAFAGIKLTVIFSNILLNLFFLFPFADYAGLNVHEHGVLWVFLANGISSLAGLLLLLKYLPAFSNFAKDKWTMLFRYGWPMLPAGLAGMVNETLDRILLKYLLPSDTAMHDVGIYGACYKVSIIMTIFIQTYRMAAEPFFFSHAGQADFKSLNAKATRFFVLFCGLIFCGTLLFMDQVQYFIGEDFRSGLHIVPILLLANWCLGVYYSSSVWYKMSEKTAAGAWISAAGALVTIVFNLLLIPVLGFVGSAWATLICYASMMLISFLWGQKEFPIPYQWTKMLLYLLLALGVYFISGLYAHWTVLPKILMNLLLLALYLLPVLWSERLEIKGLLRKKVG
jgi:O-antigen/teichoic acid export membrane protein